MVGRHSILAVISDGKTAKIAHVYIGTYDGQLTADSENRDSQHYYNNWKFWGVMPNVMRRLSKYKDKWKSNNGNATHDLW